MGLSCENGILFEGGALEKMVRKLDGFLDERAEGFQRYLEPATQGERYFLQCCKIPASIIVALHSRYSRLFGTDQARQLVLGEASLQANGGELLGDPGVQKSRGI